MLKPSIFLNQYPAVTPMEMAAISQVYKYPQVNPKISLLNKIIGHYPQRIAKDRVTWYGIRDDWDGFPSEAIWVELEVRDQILIHKAHKDYLYGTLFLATLIKSEDDEVEYSKAPLKINFMPETTLRETNNYYQDKIHTRFYELEIVCSTITGLHNKYKKVESLLGKVATILLLKP
jgi:hypothetical protein